MDSFGFDFPGGDLIDLGSLGMWGNSTPLGSSPNGSGLPFSVGTPTGVQSLVDEPFSSLPGGSDDFSFADSPKASPGNRKSGTNDTADDLYFGADLDTNATAGDANSEDNKAKVKAEGDANSNRKDPNADQRKSAADQAAGTGGGQAPSPASGANASSTAAASATSSSSMDHSGGLSSYLMSDPSSGASANPRGSVSFPNNNSNAAPKSSPNAAASQAATAGPTAASARNPNAPSASAGSGASTAATSTTSSATSASTNSSSARPHIDGPGSAAPSPSGRPGPAAPQQQQPGQPQQQQQRYPNQMMMNPGAQPGQPNFAGQPYPVNPQGPPMAGPGQVPQPQVNGQYMQPQYRPPNSSYDEEFMRVKAMMMQHPDLIPPPMEVLRISMTQSATNQHMMQGAANYMQRPGQVINRVGPNGAYAPYGAPNPALMIPPQGQPGMMDPARMRAMPPQMAGQQRPIPQTRTPDASGPDTQAAWQSENDLPLRRKMIGKIVSLLQQRKPDAPAEWIRRLPDMARRLEDSLYRTAKNRDEYGDFSSLKTRLQHLAVTMGARAQHKAGNPRAPGVMPAGTTMMQPSVPPGMAMNPAMGTGMTPQGHVVGNMQYANRMTQQQLMQQQQLQMQMQNPQMRQQFTPQQLQQYQATQLQRRQFQMQQAQQQAQMQRQTTLQQQQFQQNQAIQRQNSMRQQQQMQQQQQPGANVAYPMDPANKQQQQQQQLQQMNQRAQNPNYLQQQQRAAQNAQAQRQAQTNGNNGTGRQSVDMNLGQALESSDFLNLDLSQSLLGGDELQGDGGSGIGGNLSTGDAMKTGTGDSTQAGQKRTLTQTQQQMAAAANAAAFKRTKVGGPGTAGRPTNSPQASQNAMQKPVQGASGSSKTPPMSTVNAK